LPKPVHFLVALGACLVAQKISLLPSTRTLAVLRQIEEQYPGTFCLHDGEGLGELCSDADDRDSNNPAVSLPADLSQDQKLRRECP